MRTGMLITGMWMYYGLLLAQYPERLTRQDYFETYKEIAVHEMERSGIPASITLAQGALESGDGNSRLAREGNNHFGIKCHTDWKGKKIFEDDDSRNECFRKYPSADESFRDHSDYLRTKTRYAFLFDLNITDYKGWAKGLKKAGYATSSTYAEALIKIIEENNLSIYDRMTASHLKSPERARNSGVEATSRPILERNRVKYILARKGDTFDAITEELDKLSWELPQYNDVRNPDSLVQGQIVYIQPKRNKAEAGKNTHTVKEGETVYMISQLYAIKLDRLYAMNNLNPGTRPSAGTILQLRKPVKNSGRKQVPVTTSFDEPDEEEIRIDIDL